MRAATLARVSLVALALATFLAIFRAEELKREAPALLLRPVPGVLRFEPGGGGAQRSGLRREAHFRVPAPVAAVLAGAGGSAAPGRRVFVFRVPVHEYAIKHLAWNGTTSAGVPAAPGYYLLRIHFERRDETLQAGLTLALVGRTP